MQTEVARLKLKDAAHPGLYGAKYELEITICHPGDAILAEEKRCAADLVVMATHGRRGVSQVVLGSLAERVVRSSSVPVLTIRPSA